MIICVDVDNTILDPAFQENGWFWFLQYASNMSYTTSEWEEEIAKTNGVIDYNLVNYFPDITQKEGFAFWQRHDLYQKLKLYPEAVEVLREVGQKHKLVFTSYCKSGHAHSKYDMLVENFKNHLPEGHFAFVNTKEKWAVKCDMVIDDRNEFINMFDPYEVSRILFTTNYTQTEPVIGPVVKTNNWYEIKLSINNLEDWYVY